MISKHSLITEDSTHPPETEPEKSPFSLTIILLPIGCGDDPHVHITVARAIFLPAFNQLFISFKFLSSNEFFIIKYIKLIYIIISLR